MSNRSMAAPRGRRSRILATSFGATLLFVGAVIVALALSGKDADAATYTLTTTVPTTNWGDSTKGSSLGINSGSSSTNSSTIALNGGTFTMTLAPFEYRQTDVAAAFGLSNIYNARVAVKVVDGDGRVTAYGSVIDMKTQDPTYVEAQQ